MQCLDQAQAVICVLRKGTKCIGAWCPVFYEPKQACSSNVAPTRACSSNVAWARCQCGENSKLGLSHLGNTCTVRLKNTFLNVNNPDFVFRKRTRQTRAFTATAAEERLDHFGIVRPEPEGIGSLLLSLHITACFLVPVYCKRQIGSSARSRESLQQYKWSSWGVFWFSRERYLINHLGVTGHYIRKAKLIGGNEPHQIQNNMVVSVDGVEHGNPSLDVTMPLVRGAHLVKQGSGPVRHRVQ